MYFTIKYKVFYKYIINATTTAIHARKNEKRKSHIAKNRNWSVSKVRNKIPQDELFTNTNKTHKIQGTICPKITNRNTA
jgi:hypothetical protein